MYFYSDVVNYKNLTHAAIVHNSSNSNNIAVKVIRFTNESEMKLVTC